MVSTATAGGAGWGLSTGTDQGRQTIAVLVDWLKDGYQSLVFAGMADAARDLDVNLVCLPGGVLRSPLRFGSQRNLIYNFAAAQGVHGILLLSGTLGNHVGPAELGRFCERFAPRPIISLAVPLPGIPTVVVDDAEGMRGAMRHLTQRHGCKRIAFIRGPEVNEEAERRFSAYRQVLNEAGIAFDDRLVAPGDFQAESGTSAVRLILDERNVSVDALVAANDHMALGALRELNRRGIKVPEQVALVGFDDIDEARFAVPPLTTVRQPLYRQGLCAVEIMVGARRAGGEATFKMKTDLIVRESCGCAGGPVSEFAAAASVAPQGPAIRDSDRAIRDSDREEELRTRTVELARVLGGRLGENDTALPPGWADDLVACWTSDVLSGQCARFIPFLRQCIGPTLVAGLETSFWQNVITTMREALVPLLIGDERRRQAAEVLWHEAREQIAAAAERVQARERQAIDRTARLLTETSEALSSAVDLQSLARVLAERLPQFGIPGAQLCLFDGDEVPPRRARTILAFPAGPSQAAKPDEAFPLWDLLPVTTDGQERRRAVVIQPLLLATQQFGFLLLEVGPRGGIIYESLREQVSAAVNTVRLLEQVVRETESRVQGQKLEAIGTLAAGIAHELNTPIQFVGDSVAFLKEAVAAYQRALEAARGLLMRPPADGGGGSIEDEVKAIEEAEDLAFLDEEAPKACERSEEGVRRMAGIVSAMKEFARADARAQAFADVNRAILNTLEVSRSEYKDWADIALKLEELPPVRCYIGELNQVFLNLIVNAAHAIEDVVKRTGRRGLITVSSRRVGEDIVIEIGDSGGGIPAAIQDKVFEPFFTTKPIGRGSGQGLAISRAAVVGKHGGTLSFQSESGAGTVFRIRLPIAGKPGSAAVGRDNA